MIGYEGLVRNVVNKIRQELGTDCIAIATGGLSSQLVSLKDLFFSVEPNLTLNGLRAIGEWMNENRKSMN